MGVDISDTPLKLNKTWCRVLICVNSDSNIEKIYILIDTKPKYYIYFGKLRNKCTFYVNINFIIVNLILILHIGIYKHKEIYKNIQNNINSYKKNKILHNYIQGGTSIWIPTFL